MEPAESQCAAIQLGLLRFPDEGQVIRGRRGNVKPYLLDTRGAVSNLPLRTLIVDQLSKNLGIFPSCEVVAGIAKSGTIWGAWLAWAKGFPFANVLIDGPRESGLKREVEGEVSGRKVILVDNWVRTGESLQKAKAVCEQNGAVVLGAISISINSGLNLDMRVQAVWEIDDLVQTAFRLGLTKTLRKE